MAARQILDNSNAPGMSLDDIAQALHQLAARALLALNAGKGVATLSEAGFDTVSAPGFKAGPRAQVPSEALEKRPRSAADEKAAALFGIAMASGTGGDGPGD